MHRILIVEDDLDILFVTKVSLEQSGYVTITATSAEEALTLLDHHGDDRDINAILLDIRLPGMDGWTFLERLRSMGRLGAVPVIVTSAHDASALASRGSEFGCAAYLVKPYSPTDLVRALGAALPAA